MAADTAYRHCAVTGCNNSRTNKPFLFFFPMPTMAKMWHEWALRAGRPELVGARHDGRLQVCSEHFHHHEILRYRDTVHLKSYVAPSLKLPATVQRETGTQTETTDPYQICDTTDASQSQQLGDSTKRAARETVRRVAGKSRHRQKQLFYHFCEKLLNPDESMLLINHVKAQPDPKLKSIPITTDINKRVLSALKHKAKRMTKKDRICAVVVDVLGIQSRGDGDAGSDGETVWHEVDGVQGAEPATTAMVVMLRGIASNWHQPVGFAFLSEYEHSNTSVIKWLDELITKIGEVGLEVRALVSDMKLDTIYQFSKSEIICAEKNTNRKDKRIFFFYDPSTLFIKFRDVFMASDLHFYQGCVASYKCIRDVYATESKEVQLLSKLTESHIDPTGADKSKVHLVAQVFSNTLAAVMQTMIVFNKLYWFARDTVKLIKFMNDFYDLLHGVTVTPDRDTFKRAYKQDFLQLQLLTQAKSLFGSLKAAKKSKIVTVLLAKLVECFQVTILSIMFLFEDLNIKGINFLRVKWLSTETTRNFFERIKAKYKTSLPTSAQFLEAYKDLFIKELHKPSTRKKIRLSNFDKSKSTGKPTTEGNDNSHSTDDAVQNNDLGYEEFKDKEFKVEYESIEVNEDEIKSIANYEQDNEHENVERKHNDGRDEFADLMEVCERDRELFDEADDERAFIDSSETYMELDNCPVPGDPADPDSDDENSYGNLLMNFLCPSDTNTASTGRLTAECQPAVPTQARPPEWRHCCVFGCINNSLLRPSLKFFSLPSDEKRRAVWLQRIRRPELASTPPAASVVCEQHFYPREIADNTLQALPALRLPTLDFVHSIEGKTEKTDVSIQTAEICDHPIQRADRKRRLSETQNRTDAEDDLHEQKEAFRILCDKLLTPEVAAAVKSNIQTEHKTESYSITTQIDDRLFSVLKAKVDEMKKKERICCVIIDTTDLQVDVQYDESGDQFVGLHEVEGAPALRAAAGAVLVLARGLVLHWQQPVGYALVSERETSDGVFTWINKLFTKLDEIGLDVRAVVSKIHNKYDFASSLKLPEKIRFVCDPASLLLRTRDIFVNYNIHFGDSEARLQHVAALYKMESKKQVKLVPKLTREHLRPDRGRGEDVRLAAQLFSAGVAGALHASVGPAAAPTATFIRLLNDLHDLLTGHRLGDVDRRLFKRAYTGDAAQLKLLREAEDLFAAIDRAPQNRRAPGLAAVVRCYRASVAAVRALGRELAGAGLRHLRTRRLTARATAAFFERTKRKLGAAPTCLQFAAAYRQFFFDELLRAAPGRDPAKLVRKYLECVDAASRGAGLVLRHRQFDFIALEPADYYSYPCDRANNAYWLAMHLLRRCLERQKTSVEVVTYIVSVSDVNLATDGRYGLSLRYLDPRRPPHLAGVPRDDLVHHVLRMDEVFRSYFGAQKPLRGVARNMFGEVSQRSCPAPWPRFPAAFLAKLFVVCRLQLLALHQRSHVSPSTVLPALFA